MNARIVTLICSIFLAAYTAAFVVKSTGPQGMILDQNGRPQLTDHLSLWSAGRLAIDGRPDAAYDWSAHEAEMAKAMGHAPAAKLQFSYPPSFFTVLAPLAALPYSASFVLFGLLTLIPFAFLCARIVGRPDAALWMLATVPPFWNIAVGQTGALAATLFAAGLLLLPARPLMAGAMFGLLTFKPHLGLLIPIALLASGNYRAIAAAAGTALSFAFVSFLAFGPEPWLAFGQSLGHFGAYVLTDTNPAPNKLQSLFGLLRALGLPSQAALMMQIAFALGLAALTWAIWRRPLSSGPDATDLRSALLLVCAALASPYTFHYDLVILTAAQAFLLRHALRRGIVGNDVISIVAINLLIVLFPVLMFPTAFFGGLAMLAMLLHRLHIEAPLALPWPRRMAPPISSLA